MTIELKLETSEALDKLKEMMEYFENVNQLLREYIELMEKAEALYDKIRRPGSYQIYPYNPIWYYNSTGSPPIDGQSFKVTCHNGTLVWDPETGTWKSMEDLE